MLYLKRLFAGPPNTRDLRQQHDVAGLLAARAHNRAWVRRDAAAPRGRMQEPRARAPLTTALEDRDAEVRHAAQAAPPHLNASDAASPPARTGG
jgi:HEAT repeat protein